MPAEDLDEPQGGEHPAKPMTEKPAGRTLPADAAGTQGVTEKSVTGQGAPSLAEAAERVELFRPEQVAGFRDRWRDVQTSFADDPQRTLREADQLAAEVTRALVSTFAEHQHELEARWQRGEATAEDLRLALRRYRTLLDLLLRG